MYCENEFHKTILSDSQYEWLMLFMPSVKTKPLKYEIRSILSGIFYLIKTGCQWRFLHPCFPPWQVVYYHFRKFIKGMFSLVYSALCWTRRAITGNKDNFRKAKKLIIDSQSIKTVHSAGIRGIDGNKKIKGIKRHILVDTQGLLHTILITPANIHDSVAAKELLYKHNMTQGDPKEVLADKGYRGSKLQDWLQYEMKSQTKIKIPNKPAKILSNNDPNFNVYKDRWVVERSFAWLNYYRRLWRNSERIIETTEAVTQLAFLNLMLNRLFKKRVRW